MIRVVWAVAERPARSGLCWEGNGLVAGSGKEQGGWRTAGVFSSVRFGQAPVVVAWPYY